MNTIKILIITSFLTMSCAAKQNHHIIVTVPETTYHLVGSPDQIPGVAGKWGFSQRGEIWVMSRKFRDGVLPDRETLMHEVMHSLKRNNDAVIEIHDCE